MAACRIVIGPFARAMARLFERRLKAMEKVFEIGLFADGDHSTGPEVATTIDFPNRRLK